MRRYLPLLWAGLCALVVGALADGAGIPGGLIFGAVVGAAMGTLWYGKPIPVPVPMRTVVMIAIGAQIGMRVTRETLDALHQAFLPAVGAALLLILAGVGITVLLRWMGRAPDGDLLATSPGALEVLVGLAADEDYNAVQVAMFHLVRILLVVLLLPAILWLIT